MVAGAYEQAWIAHDSGGEGLFVSFRDGLVWTTERVDALGAAPSITLDLEGNPVVAYEAGDSIRLATRDAAARWSTSTVLVGEHSAPAVAVSDEGAVHVAFIQDGLHDAVLGEAGWTIVEVDPAARGAPALAAGGGAIFAVYATPTGLAYARHIGDEWRIDEIWSGVVAGTPSYSGDITFAVSDGSGGFDVWYATGRASDWWVGETGEKTSSPEPRIGGDSSIAYVVESSSETQVRALPRERWIEERVASGPGLTGVAISAGAGRGSLSYATDEGVFFAQRWCAYQ